MLAIPLLLLGYSNVSSHTAFKTTIDTTIEDDAALSLTAQLQRDIMDLQRNVLIYKDSASKSAEKSSHKLYDSIVTTINDLKKLRLLASKTDEISRMEEHLNDYKNSFDIVIKSRELKERLIIDFTTKLQEEMDNLTNNSSLNPSEILKITKNINNVHQGATSFFITNNHQHINTFNGAIRELESQLKNSPKLLSKVEAYKKSFMKTVNVQRNYIYLINVVMTGSAREILYSSDKLTQSIQVHTNDYLTDVSRDINSENRLFFALSIASLIMAVIAPWYFLSLVIRPIQNITEVLKKLTKGDEVDTIPGLERSDEIGLLANAANVFKAKNELTSALLHEAEQFVVIQQGLNHDLSEAKSLAEKSLAVKSDFLANMSHELRTPLNAIIGYTVRLLKNAQTFSERQVSSLRAVERNGKHLLAMINDILDLSKIEANKLEMRFEEVELYQLCHDVVDQMRTYSDEQGVSLIYAPPENLEQWLVTDPTRLSQILINLLSNGLKYTEQGSVTLTISPAVSSQWVELTIRDTGIGISEQDIERLFQRFEQFDSETRNKVGQGTGLGMAIVENVARLLKAQIEVKSELGTGTEITVKIPLNPNRERATTVD